MFIHKLLFLILLFGFQPVLADSYNNQVYQSASPNTQQPYQYQQQQIYDYQPQQIQQSPQIQQQPAPIINKTKKIDWKFWQKPENNNNNKLPSFSNQELKKEEKKKAKIEKQRLKQMKKENELLKEREVLQGRMQQQIISNPANLNQLNKPQSFKAKIANAFKKK